MKIHLSSVFVDDQDKMEPTNMGPATVAVFDDTYGNLIQLAQVQ